VREEEVTIVSLKAMEGCLASGGPY